MAYDEWKASRQERVDAFFYLFEEAIEKNRVGLGFLSGIINENPDRVRIGHENLIIIGELASYCIPLKALVDTFTNPYTIRGNGMPSVEIHPKWKWLRNHQSACIQSQSDQEKPATDSLAALVLSLLDDKALFLQEGQGTLRRALFSLYGMIQSPISESISEYFGGIGATYDPSAAEFKISGTHGFVWYLECCDPEVQSITISSSYRGGPRRIHAEDTWDHFGSCRDFKEILEGLSVAPGSMAQSEEYNRFLESKKFTISVARHFAPLRRVIEQHLLLNDLGSRYPNWVEVEG